MVLKASYPCPQPDYSYIADNEKYNAAEEYAVDHGIQQRHLEFVREL
jgi:hypothetical protein